MTGNTQDGAEQPRRILMTADAVGGVWRYSVDLIAGLVAGGSEVLLATMGPPPTREQKQQIAALPDVTLAQSEYALEWMKDPWAEVDAAGEWLRALAREFRPDVVHLNGYAHAALACECPVVVVAHSCVFSWWRAVHGCAPGAEWSEYHARVVKGLAAADAIVAPSAAMAGGLAAEYNLPPERVGVIHNFSPTETLAAAEKQPYFLAAGRVWDSAKNFGLLEEIAPQLAWEMRVSGSDRGPGQATPGVTSVRYLGMLPYSELLEQMSRASVFVHPALYEPFGLSVLEAARRRCCLVLADIPSLRELWSGAALFVDPRSPHRWVSALEAVRLDEMTRRDLGERACARSAQYSEMAALDQYRRVYGSLAARQRSGRGAAA